jgi:hypothetical protein
MRGVPFKKRDTDEADETRDEEDPNQTFCPTFLNLLSILFIRVRLNW